jgi:hypothetical protein
MYYRSMEEESEDEFEDAVNGKNDSESEDENME